MKFKRIPSIRSYLKANDFFRLVEEGNESNAILIFPDMQNLV